jgi:hypothetical protein
MASSSDRNLLKQWSRQRNNKDWDTYLWRIGDPPTHICDANERILREAEEGEGKEWGRGMGSGRERERGREKGIIHLEDDSSGNESVDSDVEEVVQWDRSLRNTKTFKTAVLILSGRKFESPNLELLQKILPLFINEPTSDYFKKKSSQATAFENIQAACKAGWKTEHTRKKKWSVRFSIMIMS